MRTSVRGAEYLRLLRGKHLERGVQEEEKTPVKQGLRLRLLNASVISTLLYGCESWKLPAQARRKLNGTV